MSDLNEQLRADFEAVCAELNIPTNSVVARKLWEAARRAPAAAPAPVAAIKPSSLLTDKELADPEYVRAYVDELHGALGTLSATLAAVPAAAPVVQPVGVTYLDMDGCPDIRIDMEALMHVPAGTIIYAGAAPSSTAEAKDAARWRETVKHIGGTWTDVGAQRFTLRYLSPVEGANIMQGSVAEHFTQAIDAAIASSADEVNP